MADRPIDLMLHVAEALRKLALDLESEETAPAVDYLLQCLNTGALYIEKSHEFIESTPAVIQRGKAESFVEGYRAAAGIVREFAAEVERGKVGPIRPHAALLRAAAVLDAACDETHGPRPSPGKPKLVLN